MARLSYLLGFGTGPQPVRDYGGSMQICVDVQPQEVVDDVTASIRERFALLANIIGESELELAIRRPGGEGLDELLIALHMRVARLSFQMAEELQEHGVEGFSLQERRFPDGKKEGLRRRINDADRDLTPAIRAMCKIERGLQHMTAQDLTGFVVDALRHRKATRRTQLLCDEP